MSQSDAAKRRLDIGGHENGEIRFPRIDIGGLAVAVLDRRQTAIFTIAAALSRRGAGMPCLFFTTANGQVISLAAANSAVRELLHKADLISADGMSVVFMSRFAGRPGLPERVATTDAFHDAAGIAVGAGASFYLLGGSEEVNAAAAARLARLYPELRIAGRRSGYYAPEDEPAIVDEINAARPDVLWVGLGVPAQQRFICEHRHRLTAVGVAKTCGGLFDFLAGRNRRAPAWMQSAGLEWAFRAALEPRRLAWRYITTNPHAFYCMLMRSSGPARDGFLAVGDATAAGG